MKSSLRFNRCIYLGICVVSLIIGQPGALVEANQASTGSSSHTGG